MNRMLPLAAALLLVPLAAPLLAQSPDAGRGHARLDANGDGVIDRAEAAKAPRLAAHFDTLDRNDDGRLSADERPQHRGKGRKGAGGMERLDTDKDGRLSRAEFDAGQARREAMRARHAQKSDATGTPRATLPRPDFAAIDSNRDGYLVGSELRAHHERMKPQREALHRQHMDAKFKSADINGDGKLGRVEVDEKLPRLKERFQWLDENRDGFITRAELQATHGRR